MSSSLVFADEDRHLAVDQAIGGMEQGSRISAPDAKGPAPLTDMHKTIFSSQGTKKEDSIPVTVGSNHGNIYSAPGSTNNPVDTGVSQPATEPIKNPIDSGVSPETPIEDSSAGNGGSTPVDTGGANEPTAGSGGSETDTGDTSNNPIVDVDAGLDLESGTVEADTTVDTTGELEEKQIFETDLEVEGVGSIDADVSSAADITGAEVVEGADVTTDATTETGQPAGQTGLPAGEADSTESPSTESTQENNPIVDTQVSTDLESGKVEADATIDTSGELEERQIMDADLATGETTAGAEVGSATDVTQSDTVASTDITTQPVSGVTIPSDLTAEVDTTGETTGGEADVGVEADVSGISEGEDVTCDPADGLTSAACGVPQL